MKNIFLLFVIFLFACPFPKSTTMPSKDLKDLEPDLKCWIIPPRPSTLDDLTAVPQFKQGNPNIFDIQTIWYVNGGMIPNQTSQSLSHEFSRRNDKISAQIYLDKGDKSWGPFDCGALTVQNSWPVFNSIKLNYSEDKTYLETQLKVFDPDGDDLEIDYLWRKNGQVIDGENEATLPTTYFANKNDRITVSATISDGQSNPVTLTSEGISLVSRSMVTSPFIKSLTWEPASPTTDSTITAIASFQDSEGDKITLVFDWYVNGEKVKSGTSNQLGPSFFKKGDSVVIEARAKEEQSNLKPLRSRAIIIKNSPPRITSTPPVADRPFRYTYQVEASDPDDDKITFSLEESLGLQIDSDTGLITWGFSKVAYGNHPITVRATDDEGAQGIQTFTLRLSPGRSIPEVGQ